MYKIKKKVSHNKFLTIQVSKAYYGLKQYIQFKKKFVINQKNRNQ